VFHSLIYRFGRYQLKYLSNVHPTKEWKDEHRVVLILHRVGLKAPLNHKISIQLTNIELHETRQDYSSAHSRNNPLVSLSTNCWEIHYRKIISLSRIFETIDMWDDRDWKDIRILDQHLYSLCQGRRKDIYMSDKQLVNESWYDSFTKGWIILLQLLSCLLDEANREHCRES